MEMAVVFFFVVSAVGDLHVSIVPENRSICGAVFEPLQASGRQNIRCFRIVPGLEYEQLTHELLLRGQLARHSFDTCLDRQPQ